MNDHEILQHLRQGDVRVFDRLADGALSDDERRALLAALDDEPGAWRRCAIALLESEAWRQDLSLFCLAPPMTERAEQATAPQRHQRRVWALGGVWALAVAASLAVAFALGWMFGTQGTPIMVATHRDATQTPVEHGMTAADSVAADASPTAGSSRRVADETAADSSFADGTEQGDSTQADSTSWQTVRLNIKTGDRRDALDLPVVDASTNSADYQKWLRQVSSAVPAELVQELEQAGHKVTQQRRLWPINLPDGRRLVVPVEQIEVQYSGPVYQ